MDHVQATFLNNGIYRPLVDSPIWSAVTRRSSSVLSLRAKEVRHEEFDAVLEADELVTTIVRTR